MLVTLVDNARLIVTIQGVSRDTCTYFETICNLLFLALLVVLIHIVGELGIGLIQWLIDDRVWRYVLSSLDEGF